MPTTVTHIRTESHPAVGDIIEREAAVLIGRWAERARDEQPTAKRVHHDVLVDHLPVFLARLGQAIAATGDGSAGMKREAEEHGDQRWDTGWSVTEVVRDYQILRVVIAEFLEESLGRRLGSRESMALNVAVDDAVAASVAAYVASQSTPGVAAVATRDDALDILLNALGVIGHELRNPLAPLANSLEILRLAGTDPVRVDKTRQTMGRQLRVLTRLVDDMLDLPRLARGKMSLVRERVDLTQLTRACAEDRRKSLASAGITLAVEVPAHPVWVVGDETRLTQALGNLLGNAQKFTDLDGTVTIRLAVPDDRRAVISVRDTGIGIEAAVLPNVFEAYMQADRSLDRSRGGLGLGLALVKGVVELHGGSVSAHSDGPGTGATFTIELPLPKPPAA